MSGIAPELKAAARSAYRELLRASTSTFTGDEPIQRAFRLKMRTETLVVDTASQQNVQVYEEKIALAREIAIMLRRNVVQAHRTQGKDGPAWNLRFTKDSEIGDNESIKNPPPVPSGRRARKLEKGEQSTAGRVALPSSPVPRNLSALKRAHKERKIPEMREEDLEESFVRGCGPGGQSINKTENNVQLLHKPTGLRVACQETRSLQTNRMLARRLLLEKACLDKIQNPGLSKGELQRAKQHERERQRRKKAKKKLRMQQQDDDVTGFN
ncbi:RF-1 domain-containing protein [Hygrophoropsis aurantiaca]|uniref:RF-1 domain-containing protein n=1 Tax=Hygrophoropsis aurantiaca TaxID=72124 RepID=A0ACB8AGY4_9AGAM|nr:RF-1 domain-containing protein [Hygrophoropsis aurantiaca]